MQKCLPLKHGSELITNTPKELLNSGGITQKGNSHLEALRSNVTLSGKHIVGNPFHKVGRIFVLNILHLFFDVLH